MKKIFDFIVLLVEECNRDEVFSRAGELTYRLILSVFPLLIFIMSILGFLNLDLDPLVLQLQTALPEQIVSLFAIFDSEVLSQRNISLLSTSLFFAIFSASSGFMGIITGINKSYGHKETRGFIRLRILSIGLVLIFTVAIILCIVTIIFQDYFTSFVSKYFGFPAYTGKIIGLLTTLMILALLIGTVMVIYKLSNCVNQPVFKVLPGALISVIFWVVASKGFNIYIINFARYSIIYGSIGSVIILLLWLNIMSLVLLIGNEVNALLAAQ